MTVISVTVVNAGISGLLVSNVLIDYTVIKVFTLLTRGGGCVIITLYDKLARPAGVRQESGRS